jgi:hypothetical protein
MRSVRVQHWITSFQNADSVKPSTGDSPVRPTLTPGPSPGTCEKRLNHAKVSGGLVVIRGPMMSRQETIRNIVANVCTEDTNCGKSTRVCNVYVWHNLQRAVMSNSLLQPALGLLLQAVDRVGRFCADYSDDDDGELYAP